MFTTADVPSGELQAALLQATITAGLAVLCAFLYAQYRKRYFLGFALAFALYVLRLGAIIGFLETTDRFYLYLHQVLTGWTALALLWSALAVSREPRWRWRYLALVLFPPLWSYIAIYRLQQFLLAAGPAVLFLSFATLITGAVFLRYWRRIGAQGARVLAVAFLLWGVHHLDYPLLRARGALSPWSYYLDILFVLSIGVGVLLFVQDDFRRGLSTLSVLSGELQRGAREDDARGDADYVTTLLERPLALGGVRGSALYLAETGRFAGAVGACAEWSGTAPSGAPALAIASAVDGGRPAVVPGGDGDERQHRYIAVLPIFRGPEVGGALVIVGDELDPFTALGESFLVALGQQVGAALENADLYRRLAARTSELERLSARMVRQHEEERRQITLELHDETAQVFSAVKMQLGLLRESVAPELAGRVDRALNLVDAGIRSIRSVTSHLRPPLLDDLGLLPALRALATDFGERSGIAVAIDAPPSLPALSEDAELALFRALQEALSNVARHAGASSVRVTIAVRDGQVMLDVRDDGRGLTASADARRGENGGHMGLAGMRERVAALGGSMSVESGSGEGTALRVRVPARSA